MPPSNRKQRNVLLDPADDQILVEFCRVTKRDIPETMRHIFKLFFQDGMQAASDRLNAGLWNLPGADPMSTPGVRGDTPQERTDWLLQGQSPKKADESAQNPA